MSVMDDVEQITKAFNASSPKGKERMLAFANLSEEDQESLFNISQNKLNTEEEPTFQELQQARIKAIRSRYIPFSKNKKMTVENILSHLEEQLKQDLKYFSAKEDRIYLDELRKIEPLTNKMYQKLYYEHNKVNSVPDMKDIISKKCVRITKKINCYSNDSTINLQQIASAKAWREKHNFQIVDIS